MAYYNSASVRIDFDRSDGSTLQNMSAYITECNGINITASLEDSHTFGDSWVEKLFAGLRTVEEITLKGFYDDTAVTGPNAIFNDVGNLTTGILRTFKITWGSIKNTSVETIIKSFNRLPSRGALTMFEVVLAPTGAVTEDI